MRVKVAIMSGAVLALTAGTGAASAVVGHTSVSPTLTANALPIDDNHRSTAHRQPGDDRGRAVAEPGDDRGRGRGTDDATARPTGSAGASSAMALTAASPDSSDHHGRGEDGPGHH